MVETFDHRVETLAVFCRSARGDGRQGAAMESARACYDPVALRLAAVIEVLAHQLEATLHGFPAGIAEEGRVGKGRVDQAARKALLFGDTVKVGAMPQVFCLPGQGFDQLRMAMAEGDDRDPAAEIQIPSPV